MFSNKKFIFSLFLLFTVILLLPAQRHAPRFLEIDVQHYIFEIKLNDENDVIEGKTSVTIQFLQPTTSFYLDLTAKAGKKGMTVTQIFEAGKKVDFQQKGEQLILNLSEPAKAETIKTYQISYSGIPIDGLIISKNKYGDRTFFGDNWPNRAHNWLPTVDHPSDKATVEFIVIAPEYYQVVANGRKYEESNLTNGFKRTHWKESVVLPTKVMVIGVARFAVELAGFSGKTPVTSWIYPQDRDNGFLDYAMAVKVLDYYTAKIGPYPYEKLANVQSKTRYGGMENAGNIFYFEGSVTGEKDHEDLIAHEIVHQWFGNSASELNWHHIWLSEGFATYLTDLYIESAQGKDAFQKRMQSERQIIINYNKRNSTPIVNTTITNYNELLTPNAYQKGGWVLHMLRHKIGDDLFWKGIRAYYEKYQFSNALTKDFQKVMEEVSGQDLESFFHQWLFQVGHPVIKLIWEQTKSNEVNIGIKQIQKTGLFNFPLQVDLIMKNGDIQKEVIKITKTTTEAKFNVSGTVKEVVLDKDIVLLFEKN